MRALGMRALGMCALASFLKLLSLVDLDFLEGGIKR